jgi:hypothetical protein
MVPIMALITAGVVVRGGPAASDPIVVVPGGRPHTPRPLIVHRSLPERTQPSARLERATRIRP